MAYGGEFSDHAGEFEKIIAAYYEDIYKFCYGKSATRRRPRTLRRTLSSALWMLPAHMSISKSQRRCSIPSPEISV